MMFREFMFPNYVFEILVTYLFSHPFVIWENWVNNEIRIIYVFFKLRATKTHQSWTF